MAALLTCIAVARPAGAGEPIKMGDRVAVNTNTSCGGQRYAKPFAGTVKGISAKGNIVVQPEGCRQTKVFFPYMVASAEPVAGGSGLVELPRADLEAIKRIVDYALAN